MCSTQHRLVSTPPSVSARNGPGRVLAPLMRMTTDAKAVPQGVVGMRSWLVTKPAAPWSVAADLPVRLVAVVALPTACRMPQLPRWGGCEGLTRLGRRSFRSWQNGAPTALIRPAGQYDQACGLGDETCHTVVGGGRLPWSATVAYCQARTLPYHGLCQQLGPADLRFGRGRHTASGVVPRIPVSHGGGYHGGLSAPRGSISLRGPLIPARRLAQAEAIGVDDLRGKLAVGNDPTPQPEGGSRLMTQLLGMAVRREGDYYPLFGVAM